MFQETVAIKKYMVVDPIGKMHDITNSSLIKVYRRYQRLPSVDTLLDWRFRILATATKKGLPGYWYELEIMAVDFLLLKHVKS